MATKKLARSTGARKAKPKLKDSKPRSAAKRASKKTALPQELIALLQQDGRSTAEAILVAAGELFSTRGPSQVSLREVAERAGVNYGLIHHYFGTKEALMSELMRAYTTYGRTFIGQDAPETTANLFNADSGNFAEIFTWMVLDGADPRKVFGDTSSMQAYTDVIEQHWRERGDPADAPFEPRLVAAFVMFNILVWDLYAPYIRALASLEDKELPELRDDMLAMLQHVVETFGPTTSSPGTRGGARKRGATLPSSGQRKRSARARSGKEPA